MLAYQITEPHVKGFMNRLLKEDLFDAFDARTVEVNTFARFQITGNGAAEGERRFCPWAEIRPYVFQIIKGGQRPKLLKITLSVPEERLAGIHANAAALFLNVAFENGEVRLATATAQRTFSLDKGLDAAWEDYVKRFFAERLEGGVLIS